MSEFCKPIAIVGMACRFPKGLEDIQTLWQALQTKFSAIDTVPTDRWTADRYYSPNNSAKGKAYMHRGGFLSHDVSMFDANFFGISPRDAENMDPQQRLMLEVTWEAFENAGLPLPNFAGRNVGVYVGGFMLDHMITQMTPANRSQINQNTAAGMMMTMLSNRVSHTFDFRGPSLSIDTACSSSLVAFNYACQDIWRGNTEMAVVGGANCMLRPEYPMGMCKGHFLSRDGECKSFDARADGYGRGEGAAAILLKPLEDAIRDNDPILATVIGTGSNQDGHTPGISMPSGEAQRALIEEVCHKFAIDPSEVRYVECHGTGTAIGDPTEADAIGSVYGAARKSLSPVVIGSIKSNIGHLEAAAGVAGVIKAVLTLMHRQATPLANLQTPNPNIPFEELGVRLSDDLIPLAADDERFCVAVNSFGYGGSNAHAILQSHLPQGDASGVVDATRHTRNGAATITDLVPGFPYLLPISARSEKSLNRLAAQYRDMLLDGVDLRDFLYTASLKRAHLSHRAVAKGCTREELVSALDAMSQGTESPNVVRGVMPFQGHRKPVLVFTGMGPQWWGMGQELYRSNAIYRAAVDEADAVFQSIAGFSALAEMLKTEETSRIGETQFAQPGNLLIQIGLFAVLKAGGVQAGAAVGHSVGELGSAYAAGVLNLKDVLTVCYHRSRLQATCAGTGSMLAVGLSKDQVSEYIVNCADRVSIAAVNGPSNLTLAGDTAEIDRIAAELQNAGVFHRKLEVEVPYHSPMMEPIMPSLAAALADVQPSMPSIPLYSTVTGKRVEEVTYGAEYWPLNIRQAVEFSTAIQSLLDDGFNTFLEVGPHPVLATSLRDCIKAAGREARTLFTLRRNTPEQDALHTAMMTTYTSGCDLDWSRHHSHGQFIKLPNYAWNRERYWLENDRAVQDRIAPIVYPMLGIQEAPGTPAWRNDFDHAPMAYLGEHVVTGMAVLPAAGYVESLLELATIQCPEANAYSVRDFQIMAPLLLVGDRGLDCVTSYEPVSQTAIIRGLENGRLGGGQMHITARLSGHTNPGSDREDLAAIRGQFDRAEDIRGFYQMLDRMGLSYGPMFQTVRELYVSESSDRILAHIAIAPELEKGLDQYCLHPTLLDACFQSLSAMLGESENMYLPTSIREITVFRKSSPQAIWCLGIKTHQDSRFIDCDLVLMDEDGEVVAILRGMRSTAATKRERTDNFGDRVKRQILGYQWNYGESLNEPKRLGCWMIVGDADGISEKVSRRLENYGAIIAAQVRLGDAYESEGNRFVVSASPEDVKELLAAAGELDGIVFLHGLDGCADDSDPTGEQALAVLATFTQEMAKQELERKPRVYVVTQSAFAVSENDGHVRPRHTAINGFVRVAFNELDGFQFSSVDLPRRTSEEILDALALELLCDAPHDEVALRGSLRLFSELLDTTAISEDRIDYQHLNDEHPILVRPLRPDCESVGTARVLASEVLPLQSDWVRVRVESTVVPTNLLLDPSSDTIDQAAIEFVGEVIEAGANVSDLTVGKRVCGFAPADLTSHFALRRSELQVVEIDGATPAAPLLTTIGLATRCEIALEECKTSANVIALVEHSPLGLVIADALARRGSTVIMLASDPEAVVEQIGKRYHVYPHGPLGLRNAIENHSVDGTFDLLVTGMEQWTKRFDLQMVKLGGAIIDTDAKASAMVLPPHVDTVARTDMGRMTHVPHKVEAALRRVVDQFQAGTITGAGSFDICIADIAWQKLPLANAKSTLVLTYDTRGQDLPVVQRDDVKFSSDASYLVTGGFGGFGQKTAEWLVHHGARHLVLTGRTGADNDARKAFVAKLEEAGATVLAAACDTADIEQLRVLFNRIEKDMPPLKGVFHSGAVIIDQPINEIELPIFRQVMQSKATGAWNLHLLTQDMVLDHFVLYSSIANLVGNSRQSAYSAANGFLNGLAHMRQAQGLPGTSVNWGAISDVGVVAQDEKLEQFLRYTGLRGIGSSEGLSVLRTGLARGLAQFGVTVITSWADWARFETRGAKSPRFATLIANDSEAKDNTLRDALVAELSQLEQADQIELLGALMVDIIASVLKADPAGISIDQSIDQLGVDSLMATEIQLLFDTKLGLSISILELIGNATIRSVATQSLKSLLPAIAESRPVAPVAPVAQNA